MSFADNLKHIRKKRGITQEEMADMLSVSDKLSPNGNLVLDILKPKNFSLFPKS